MLSCKVFLKKLPHFDESFGPPAYETAGAAGMDIKACLGVGEKIKISPGAKVLIPTGLCVEIPPGLEIQVRPRSGLSYKTQLSVSNSPGTIDSDYRGEIKVILGNIGDKDEIIFHGDRIAQIILAPVYHIQWEEQEDLSDTNRGNGGFGHTGVSS